MKRLSGLFVLVLLSIAGNAEAVTCTSIASKDWNKSSAWTGCGGKQPPAGANVIIAAGTTILADAGTNTVANITIDAGGTLAGQNGKTISLTGDFTNNGTFNSGGAGTAGGQVDFVGTAAQTISGTVTFSNVTFNNPAGVTINGTVTITGTFAAGSTPITVPAGSTLVINGVTYSGPCSGAFTAGTYCTSPTVTSINTASANPAAVGSAVSWTVLFGKSMTGVKASNFSLVMAGGVSGATITSVTGAGATWTVNANTGAGTGTLGLNMVNVTGITPAITTTMPVVGQVYTISSNTGGGTTCTGGPLPASLASTTALGFSQTGFQLNTNGGTTSVINTTVAPSTTIAATGALNALGINASPTQAVTATLPSLVPATFPVITGANGALTNPAANVAAGSYTTITLNTNTGTVVFTGGTTPTYIRKLISTKAGSTLQFAPGDYYIDSLTVSGNLTVSPAGLVRLFIGTQQTGAYGAAATTGGNNNNGFQANSQINTGGNPANLQLLLYPLVTYFEFNSNTQFTGIMYQPSVDAAAPRPNWGLPPGQFDLHTGVSITGSLYTPGVIETWGGNTFNYTPQVATAIASFSTCPPSSVHHYEISVPTTSISCVATPVTVTACADASNPCTNVATATTGSAVLATSAGSITASTFTNGIATASLSYPAAANNAVATVSLTSSTTAAANAATCKTSATTGCATTFSTAGFIFSSALNGAAANISSQVSGTTSATYYLRAVQSNTSTGACAAALTSPTTVDFAYQCNNPTTCSAGNLMDINGGTATSISGNPNTGVTNYVAVPMTFDASGNAPFTFNYSDVGQVTLIASKAAAGTLLTTLTGASNAFVVAPASISVTSVTASPIKAGAAFSATVSALNSLGNATPNFGKETAPEGVTLSSILAMGAGTWQNPALGNRVIAGGTFTNGVAPVSNLSWSEVGDISLKADLSSASYLGSGLSATGSTATTSKFIPDHFDTWIKQSGAVPMTCPVGLTCPANVYGASGMVYSGQPFIVQVIARNTTNCTMPPVGTFDPTADSCVTKNYQGTTYAQDVTLSGVGGVGGSLSNLSLSAANFTLGVGTTTLLPAYTFTATAPVAPVPINIHAAGTGVSSTAVSSGTGESGLLVAYGRIKISNAYGSELLPITLMATAQYYGTSGWTNSLTDNATIVGLASTYSVVPTSGAAGSTTPTPQNGTVTGGQLSIKLSKPGAKGVATIAPLAHSYMTTASGTATFGVYKGANEFIYLRESY